jgi:bifunctional non-homologous end joining protein LigD
LAGGVATGNRARELATIRGRLDALASDPTAGLLVAGDPLDPAIHWVRPELVAEVQFTAWSGAGRVRHPVFLGLREDKAAAEVVRDVADPEAKRVAVTPRRPSGGVGRWRPKVAVPPRRRG